MELTLLICTANRAGPLAKTLDGVVGQLAQSVNWELIVVDNVGDAETKGVVESYKSKLPISMIVEKKPGQNSARNAALPYIKGDLVVFTDDDISPKSGWLQAMYDASKAYPDVDVFGGKIIPIWEADPQPWQANAWFASFVYADQDLGDEPIAYQDGCLPSSPNMAIRKTVFDQGIIFNTRIGPIGSKRISGSETEFLTRVLSKSKGLYLPESQVLHRITNNMLTRKYLRKRCYTMGLGMSVWAPSPQHEASVPKLFGVARYRIGRMLTSALKTCYQTILLNKQAAIEEECRAALELGFCIGIWTNLKEKL